MRVQIVEHALARMSERGNSEEEVLETLKRGKGVGAFKGRKAKELVFAFKKNWQGRFYPQKKVKVIYFEERDKIVVITVYTYYGEWG